MNAKPPYHIGTGGWVYDSDEDRVLSCDETYSCERLYKENAVDSASPQFICECGRIASRMAEATPKQCGLGEAGLSWVATTLSKTLADTAPVNAKLLKCQVPI